jgi:hypothetical protein
VIDPSGCVVIYSFSEGNGGRGVGARTKRAAYICDLGQLNVLQVVWVLGRTYES